MTTKVLETLGKLLVRIGLISRVDYPEDGFRLALVNRAKEDFAKENVGFVVLAGGLISGRAVKAKQMKYGRQIKAWKAQMTKLFKEQAKLERSVPKRGKGRKKAEPKDEKTLETKKAEVKAKVAEIVKNIRCLEGKITSLTKQLEELSEERLAANLAELLPKFVNAKGEIVKLFIVPSPAYDGAIGENVAQLLAAKRSADIRVFNPGSARLPIKGSKKNIEVLTPEKAVWMRGDYMSTAVERVLKDREKQRNSLPPDIQVVGCFGVTITKPAGELPRPYVAVPALHRLAETRVSENQIGALVMDVYADRVDPVVRTFSYRNFVSQERRFIGKPLGEISPAANRLIEILKTDGRSSTGMLASQTGVSRETVMKELGEVKATRNSPGVVYDPASNSWDFDLEWVKVNLRYPPYVDDNVRVDSIAAYSCLHAGSIYTDYQGFVETMTKVILARGDTILVGAGDFVAGTKHNLVLRGEVFGGLNVTQQEMIAAETIAEINIRVFKARFLDKLEALRAENKDGKVPAEKLGDAIKSSLLLNIFIRGNHDDWVTEFGITPLVVMKFTLIRSLRAAIESILVEKNLFIPRLYELVESKIVEPPKGSVGLPSGIKLSVRHPYMARAKTTSLRPQEMLAKDHDSHIVIGGNFHVAEHLELWDAKEGQRVCLQLGTIQTRTDFEDNKLKIVDQGFGSVRVESINGKITRTECAFFPTNPSEDASLKRDKTFKDVIDFVKSAKDSK